MKWLVMQCSGLIGMLVALPAQARRPLYGVVRHLDDRPAAGARVTLVHAPPGGPGCGPADVVEVVADALGKFTARLAPQLDYSAWAVLALDAERHAASPVREGACAGIELELRLGPPKARCRVELEGADAWPVGGPFQVELAAAAEHLHFLPTVDGHTPPLPEYRRALVRTAMGEPLWLGAVPERSAAGALVVTLPEPVSVVVRACAADGKPLAGVEVLAAAVADPPPVAERAWFRRPAFRLYRPVGRTAVDGLCAVLVPRPAAGVTTILLRHPGCAEAVVVVAANGQLGRDGARIAVEPGQPLDVPLLPAARLQLTEGGQPVQPAAALLTTFCRGVDAIERVAALAFAADGTAEVPLPANPLESMLHVQTAVDGPWRLQRVAFGNGQTAVVELGAQRRLVVQCRDRSGAPARGLCGVLLPVSNQHALSQQVLVATDQAGRLERWLGPDAWVVVLTDGRSWATTVVPRYDQPDGPGDQRRELVLQPLPAVRLLLADVAGQPVVGAQASLVGSMAPAAGGGTAETQVLRVMDQLMRGLHASERSDLRGVLWVPLPKEGGQVVVMLEHPDCQRIGALRVAAGDEQEVMLVRRQR